MFANVWLLSLSSALCFDVTALLTINWAMKFAILWSCLLHIIIIPYLPNDHSRKMCTANSLKGKWQPK